MSTLNYLWAAKNRNKSFVFNDLLRLERVGWPTGFEPATTSSTSLDSTIELRPPTAHRLVSRALGVKFATSMTCPISAARREPLGRGPGEILFSSAATMCRGRDRRRA